MNRNFASAESRSFLEPEYPDDDHEAEDDGDFHEPEIRDDVVTDAEASGLINDAIDRCFEATMRGYELP